MLELSAGANGKAASVHFGFWRFNARMTPMRANIVRLPPSATRISAARGLPFRRGVLFRQRGDVLAGVEQRHQYAIADPDGILERPTPSSFRHTAPGYQ
ncbi:hypothetical protein [Bradyrhizobium barranii]|uniref:hypothetical protein n=1 Tax=Bradyrhizobium barranii TaxID=2992140 RepID=UPI00140DACF4|nr:hypothetical protein [Bradyrhizobium barranii]